MTDLPNLQKWIKFVEDRPYNDNRYFINSKKLTQLGWEPEITFIQGLTELIKKG